MLNFKEFVFKTWELRGAPVGNKAEETFLFWNDESPYNPWWRRYQGWQNQGCPMPVEDIAYDEMALLTPVPQEVPTLTFEEFFVAKMNQAAPGMQWSFEKHFPHEIKEHTAGWQKTYADWVSKGCPPIEVKVNVKPQPTKKPIRYLNRVNA